MINKFIMTLFISHFFAAVGFATGISLQVGDIILLPLKCYVCTLIEDETDSEYSHSGIVVKTVGPQIYIAQALGNVHEIPLKQFLKMKDPKRSAKIVRAYELSDAPVSSDTFYSVYVHKFKGLPFDHDYLWNNYNDNKEEELYCAEFLTKLINQFLKQKVLPTPMQYHRNYDYWVQYFGHNPPQDLPGVSPSTFEKSPLFFTVGNL